VVDIGCGCGATVLELAHGVGPGGHVLGLDVSEPMSARARARIAAEGLTNAEVLVSDAASHPFPAGSIDLLFSRFGVMFFDDPIAAFTHLRRAMKPDGRLLFAVWRPLAENTWFTVPLTAALPLLPPMQPTDPLAPGPFAFSNPKRVHAILDAAGWQNVSLVPEDVPMHLGVADKALEFATGVDPDLRQKVEAAVAAAVQPYDSPRGVTLGGGIWLVSARA